MASPPRRGPTCPPKIGQAMVYGDRKPNLVAPIVPDEEVAREWAEKAGKDAALTEVVQNPDFVAAIEAAVGRINANLSVIERVRKFALHGEPFTIENELLTPSLMIRRHLIVAAHRDTIEALYAR